MWPLRACYQNEYIESNRWIWEESRTSYFLEGPGRIRRTGFRFQHFRVKRTSAKEMHAACLQVIDASLDLELTLIHLFPDDLAWPSKLWASFTWNRAVPVFLKFCLRDLLVFLRIFWGIFWDLLESFEILSFGIFAYLLGSFGIFWDLLESFEIFWDLLRSYLLGSFEIFSYLCGSFGIFWDLIFWDLLESFEILFSGIFWDLFGSWWDAVAAIINSTGWKGPSSVVEVEENEAKEHICDSASQSARPGTYGNFLVLWDLLESCEICSNLLGSVWIFGDLGTKWYKCGPNICPTFEC